MINAAKISMAEHVEAMLAFHNMGIPTFDYGNNIRQMAHDMGLFVPLISPVLFRRIFVLFCRGIGPFRWVALSGNPDDIYKTDAKVKALILMMHICIIGWIWRVSVFVFKGCQHVFAGLV